MRDESNLACATGAAPAKQGEPESGASYRPPPRSAALARRRRSEDGQPVVGRIPSGPHRMAEARAHLAREITFHQAKLDRYAALVAAGRNPMGRPPVPMERSTRV